MYRKSVFIFALAVLVFLPFYAQNVSAAGITICGVDYNCGDNTDGICPTTYGANCAGVCDINCGGTSCVSAGTPCQEACIASGDRYYCAASVCQDCGLGNTWDGAQCITPGFVCKSTTLNQACAPAPVSYQSAQYYCDVSNNCKACSAGQIYRSGVCVPAACGASTVCSGGGETCLSCALDCGACAAPTVSISFNPVSNSLTNGSGSTFTATVTGTTDAVYGTMTLCIDQPSNLVLQAGTLCQAGIASGGQNSVTFAAPLPGTYSFTATESDSGSGGKSSSQNYVVRNSNTPPIVTWVQNYPSRNSLLNREQVDYWFIISDDKPNIRWVIDYGDGYSNNGSCQSTVCEVKTSKIYQTTTANSPLLTGQVTFGTSTVTTVTATDSDGASSGASFGPFTPEGLDPVQGTPTGAPTYTNDSSECAADSCAQQKAGWWNCFSVNACYPDNSTMCASPTNPPTFIDRDTSQAACEASSSTCTAYTYATYLDSVQTNTCCGAKPNEYLPTVSYGAQGCCSQPNKVFSTAGIAGCYDGVENTLALCVDSADNDADGFVDGADLSCGPTTINGTVTLIDDQGVVSAGLGATVSIDGIKKSTYTCTISGVTKACYSYSKGELLLGTKNIFASKESYTVGAKTINAATNGEYTVDFTLNARRCNDDCTNSQGLCDTSCIGVGNCQPTPEENRTLAACDPQGALFGRPKGTEVILDTNATGKLVGVCCKVPGVWRESKKADVSDNTQGGGLSGSIDTLVKYTTIVYIDGTPYRLVVNTW